jgi:chitin disaccharide deacetylase
MRLLLLGRLKPRRPYVASLVLALAAHVLVVKAAETPDAAIRLVVQADDMGAAHGIDVATIDAFQHGIVRATNVIIPAPWLPEAARLLNENPRLEVGVHLALTSEWSSIKWRPLTHAPSLVDAHGFFYPTIWPDPNFPPGSALKEHAPEVAEIERELRAQIELARAMIPHVSYASEHMGFDGVAPEVHDLVIRLMKEYRLFVPGDVPLQILNGVWKNTDGPTVRVDKLAAKLETLGPGTWLMIDHVALDTPETRAIGHPGYEFVAADRSSVLAAWTSPKVMEVITRRGIVLTSRRELLKHRASHGPSLPR